MVRYELGREQRNDRYSFRAFSPLWAMYFFESYNHIIALGALCEGRNTNPAHKICKILINSKAVFNLNTSCLKYQILVTDI